MRQKGVGDGRPPNVFWGGCEILQMDRLATGTWKIFLNRADDGRKEVAMGQIANQMLLEWCHKMARKIGEKRKNRDVRKQRPEEAGKKERR